MTQTPLMQVSASQPIKILIPAAFLLGLGVVRDLSLWGGFAIGLALIIFLPWSIYSLARMLIKPMERRARAIHLVIWTTALVVPFGIRAQWDTTARKDASAAASAIQSHKALTGSYPNGLSEVGFDAEALKDQISLRYRLSEGQPILFYSQPSMPTLAHHYNFEADSWAKRD